MISVDCRILTLISGFLPVVKTLVPVHKFFERNWHPFLNVILILSMTIFFIYLV